MRRRNSEPAANRLPVQVTVDNYDGKVTVMLRGAILFLGGRTSLAVKPEDATRHADSTDDTYTVLLRALIQRLFLEGRKSPERVVFGEESVSALGVSKRWVTRRVEQALWQVGFEPTKQWVVHDRRECAIDAALMRRHLS